MEAISGALGDLWTWYGTQIDANGGFWLLLILYVGMFGSERLIYALHADRRSEWDDRDSLANVVTSTTVVLVEAAGLGIVFGTAYLFVYDHLALFRLPEAWWAFVFAFVLNDFLYWLDHYVSHRNGFFWTFHQTHHSSREMNLTVASRAHVLLSLFQPLYLFLPLLGVSLTMAIAVKIVGNLWGIFNHTRLVRRMGPLDRWLCTPSVHRVHHGTQAKYLDRNYGQTLLIWDRLFGTWQPEEEEPVYGLVTQLETYNPVRIQTAPLTGTWRLLRQAPDWRARLGYLWHPPGWSHTGEHCRSEELRERERAARQAHGAEAHGLSPAE